MRTITIRAVPTSKLPQAKVRRFAMLLLGLAAILGACGLVSDDANSAQGWPDVDLGVSVVEYRQTPERSLYIHVFSPGDTLAHRGSVLFFHGGGFARTRVPQFEHQAKAVADNGMFAFIIEYRVTSEGTTADDASLTEPQHCNGCATTSRRSV